MSSTTKASSDGNGHVYKAIVGGMAYMMMEWDRILNIQFNMKL